MSTLDRRSFLSLLGLTGTSIALGGCVGQPAPAPQSASSIRPASPADAKGEITYWNHFTGEDERRGFEAVTSGFAKTYPGVALKSESLPEADFMTKFTTAVQSRSVPNSVMVHAKRVQDMVAMQGLIDLTDAVTAWSGSSDINAKILAAFQRDGRTYAIPAALFVDWYYYRPDWLEEAGISSPPSTWAEFREAARKMTDARRDRYGFSLRGGPGGGEHVIKMIRGYNGPLVSADGKPTLTKEAVATAIEEYSATYLVDSSVPRSAPNDGYNQIFQSFLTGRTGMLMHHTGSLKSVTAALKPGTQVMTAPMPKAEFETGWLQPLGNGLMSSDGAETSLAWLEYWGSSDPQVDFFNATGYFPVSTKAQASSTITSIDILKAALDQVKVGVTPEYFRGLQAWQDNSVLVQFQSVLVEKTSISQAADTIVADFQKNF